MSSWQGSKGMIGVQGIPGRGDPGPQGPKGQQVSLNACVCAWRHLNVPDDDCMASKQFLHPVKYMYVKFAQKWDLMYVVYLSK